VFVFASKEMNFSMREIWKASSMVQVEVCHNDMPNVSRLQSMPRNLVNRGFVDVSGAAQSGEEQAHPASRFLIITKAESRIHKHWTLVRFNQQASHARTDTREVGTQRSTIQATCPHRRHRFLAGHLTVANAAASVRSICGIPASPLRNSAGKSRRFPCIIEQTQQVDEIQSRGINTGVRSL
jgi:hypothetical protein